jgi:NH3-dependent NAD+ synthetase
VSRQRVPEPRVCEAEVSPSLLLTSAASKRPVAAVGISGGVDSSVAALLLKRHGFDVVGVHMRNWDAADERAQSVPCRADDDLQSAKAVCAELDIPLRVVDFVQQYWNNVFEPFLEAYASVRATLLLISHCAMASHHHHRRAMLTECDPEP